MLPAEFLDEIAAQLGDELPDFLRAMEQPPALALRINALRPGAQDAAKPYIEAAVPWAAGGYYLKLGARPGADLAHDLGAFYLQEASAMTSAAALDARPGERVLDLCAAPGGKSTQIAAAMKGWGLLISNEPVPGRAKLLAENLERWGAVNAVAVCAYPERLARAWPEFFDAVLVDAPCSGEGMFRRDPTSRAQWSPGAPAGCARRQSDILDQAALLLRPGGRLVYSTCTFNRAEDEGVVDAFLSRHPDFQPDDFSLPGLGSSRNGALRAWPHRVRGDGHFVARMSRGGVPKEPKAPPSRGVRRGGKIARTVSEESPEQLLERLEAEICRIPDALRDATLIHQADYIHALPAGTPPLDGIRAVKPGLCLMRVGRSHIQPMPALARAMRLPSDVPAAHLGVPVRAHELTEDEARRFRAGERPECFGPKGWTLVHYRGLPMGWVKAKAEK